MRVAALVGCVALAGALAGVAVYRAHRPRLSTVVFGGEGPPTYVLLHGYGSSAARWMPFTQTIWIPPHGRFVFPEAPETTVPPDGPLDGRAWWRLDLGSHIAAGRTVPELSATRPPGIKTAAKLVRELLDDLPAGLLVVGGFSQGAMVASEVAFRSDARMDALVLLSGTTVDEAAWTERLAARRGLPVFMAHGRGDVILPFDVSDGFRLKLQAAGLKVTWFPFDGGHAIPAEVVGALNEFVRGLQYAKAGH